MRVRDLEKRLAQIRRRVFGPAGPPRARTDLDRRWASAYGALDEVRDRRAAFESRRAVPEPSGAGPTSVTVITLNHDGAEHLRKLLRSLEAHVRHPRWQLVVVDHASADASREVVRAYEERLPVRWFGRTANFSFSKSNNDAALASDAELLLFINNDIVLQNDLVSRMAAVALDPRVGMVGVPLLHPGHRGGRQHHSGIDFRPDPDFAFPRPVNVDLPAPAPSPEWVPAVTAAATMVRRDVFFRAGGFDEDFEYGLEDVELCLRMTRDLGLRHVVLHGTPAVHDESATQKRQESADVKIRRHVNRRVFARRDVPRLRKDFWLDKIDARRWLSIEPLCVGLAVTEMGPDAKAGDAFTARELGAEIEKLGWHVRYLCRQDGDWYDTSDLDVLISLLHKFDPSKIHSARPGLLKIAWARSYFADWPRMPGFDLYDLVLVSSESAVAEYLELHDRAARSFHIATNPERFARGAARSQFEADVVFTGSYWGADRAIEQNLRPERLPGRSVALYGAGWPEHPDPSLRGAARGFVRYDELADVYASAKLVIDDSTEMCRRWGSLNSRVFDALGAGRLILTNCVAGSEDLFGGLLPTYRDRDELEAQIERFASNPDAREETAQRLAETVRAEHTYAARAGQLQGIVREFVDRRLRIAIKVPIPRREVAETWGDMHFARGLRRALWRLGHAVRLDLIPDWYSPDAAADDLVIALRGRSAYQPHPGHVNVLWMISHPDEVDPLELDRYDHVFVASQTCAATLARTLGDRASPLLQAFDPRVFRPREPAEALPSHELLFIGNSRFADRAAVRWAVERGLPLSVYGANWKNRIPDSAWKADHVENPRVRDYYAGADIVLNDHWPDMAREGFLSNRLFDAAAAGACIVSDVATGLEAVFGDAVTTFSGPEELEDSVKRLLADPDLRQRKRRAARAAVADGHDFGARAARILEVAEPILAARRRLAPWRKSSTRA